MNLAGTASHLRQPPDLTQFGWNLAGIGYVVDMEKIPPGGDHRSLLTDAPGQNRVADRALRHDARASDPPWPPGAGARDGPSASSSKISDVATLPGIVEASSAMSGAHRSDGLPIGEVATFDVIL